MLSKYVLSAAFAALFAAAILYNRLEFTIARDDKWQAGQDAEKVATVMQDINAVLDGEQGWWKWLSHCLAVTICLWCQELWKARRPPPFNVSSMECSM